MKLENYTVQILVPTQGYKLTQSADVAINERTISEKIVLGKYDSASNYKEISNEEAEVILKQIDEYYKSIEEANKEKENVD